MIKSHTPLQCFSPSSVSPLVSLPLHLLHLYKAECRHHPTHTHTHTHTNTHTSSPSVCAAARVSGTGSSWEQESEREKVSLGSVVPNPTSSLPSPRCAVVYQTVSRHHAVRRWALPYDPNAPARCHLENNQIAGTLWAKKRWRICAGVFFSRFTRQLRELISAQFINYRVHISPQMLKPTTPQEEK